MDVHKIPDFCSNFPPFFPLQAAKKAKDMDAPVVEAIPEDEARWSLWSQHRVREKEKNYLRFKHSKRSNP